MDFISLWGLFVSSFISATVFPGGSEVALAMLARTQQYDPWLLLSLASIGNTLGAELPAGGSSVETPTAGRSARAPMGQSSVAFVLATVSGRPTVFCRRLPAVTLCVVAVIYWLGQNRALCRGTDRICLIQVYRTELSPRHPTLAKR